MILSKFQSLLANIYNRTTNVFNNKRDEYANDDDVFKSFREGTGFSLHNEPEQVAYEYLCKHLESVRAMIKKLPKEKPNNDYIEEKIGDSINYLIIIEGLLKERNSTE